MSLRGDDKIYYLNLFLVSILPGILWVWYFYSKDKYDPEPRRLIVRDFIWGLFLVIPAGIIEGPIGPYLEKPSSMVMLFIYTVFVIGLIEEGLKSLAVYWLHFNNKEFNEPVDGIIYGVTIGLGFAAAENLFYTVLFGYQVGLIRAVLTSLAHASFTGIFGYFLWRGKARASNLPIAYGFIFVVFLHGIYDYLVMSRSIGFITTILIVLALQIYLAYLIRRVSEISPFK